jgi:hypothetical protein
MNILDKNSKQDDSNTMLSGWEIFVQNRSVQDKLVANLYKWWTQEKVDICHAELDNMTINDRNRLWYKKKLYYLRKYTNSTLARDWTFVEQSIKAFLIKHSIPLTQQTKLSAQRGIMTDRRTYSDTFACLEWLDDIIADLPQWACIAELGAWRGKALEKIKTQYWYKRFYLTWLDFATKFESYYCGNFLLADLEDWLPKNLPPQDLLYSNKTLQYVWNLSGVLADSYARLKEHWCMIYHLGYKHSFTKWVLAAFQKLKEDGYIESFGRKQDTPWMPPSVYIAIHKKSDTPTIPFPVIESTYPNVSLYLHNSDIAASLSHLYREYKLPNESLFQYQIDQNAVKKRA